MDELMLEMMESSNEASGQEASSCPMHAMRTQRTLLDADDELVFPTERDHLGALMGASPPMRELYSLIRLAAPIQATVFLQGESGSGKELVARTLHELSSRRAGPRVVCDVSA